MKSIWLEKKIIEVQYKSFSPSDLAVNKSIQKSYKPAKRKLEKKKAIKGLKAVCTYVYVTVSCHHNLCID